MFQLVPKTASVSAREPRHLCDGLPFEGVSVVMACQIEWCGVHIKYLITTVSIVASSVLKEHLPRESQNPYSVLTQNSVFILVLACAYHRFCRIVHSASLDLC